MLSDSDNPIHNSRHSTTSISSVNINTSEHKKPSRLSFDETMFGKPVMGAFLDATKSTKFNLHTLRDTTFELVPNENDISYFREDGEEGQRIPIPEHINAIGKVVCLAANEVNKQKAHPLYDVPMDDPEARVERLKKFESTFQSGSKSRDDFDMFESILREEETILCSLDCSEIVNFPSATNKALIKGLIKVAIVRHETDGLRLLFSIAEGSKSIKVEEDFFEAQSATSCVCCFVSITMSADSGVANSIASGMRMKYNAGAYFGAQFASLPVSPTFVDAVCYRLSVNEREALTVDANAGSSGRKACCAHIRCADCDCSCPCQCALPVCCGMSSASGAKSIHFEAEEVVPVVQVEPDSQPLAHRQTAEQHGVRWQVNGQVEDDVYITLHYRSLLDNRNHSCHMRIVKTVDPAKDYNRAKLFVSILGHNRNRDLKDQHYWAHHPPMDFNAIRAPSLYNSYNSAQGLGGLNGSLLGAGVCGAMCGYCYQALDNDLARRYLLPCAQSVANDQCGRSCPSLGCCDVCGVCPRRL